MDSFERPLFHLIAALLLSLSVIAGCNNDPPGSSGDTSLVDTETVDTWEDTGAEDTGAEDTGVEDTDIDADSDAGCTDGEECPSGVCEESTGACLEAACDDDVANGDETDVDCGGSCDACEEGESCMAAQDCATGVCDGDSNTCAAPACDDGATNGDETDTDCGGSCDACDDGEACMAAEDCSSGVCDGENNTCAAAACDDGVTNGDEPDTDCGGSTCDACGDGAACGVDGDCASGVCDSMTNTCAAATCDDMTQNGGESDVDCGGMTCDGCEMGDSCSGSSDCTSGVCDNNTCVAAACTDGVQNGSETDVDCGGADCSSCDDGKACSQSSDCNSGVCDAMSNTCAAPTCGDGVQNGNETDVDCGGPDCMACGDGDGCGQGSDCTSGVCAMNTMTCAAPTCGDMVQNGNETDVDCGGPDCMACADGDDCTQGSDCTSRVCDAMSNTCSAPTCSDGIQNGNETDVDCGGSDCSGCSLGDSCNAASDCQADFCSSGSCYRPTSCKDIVDKGLASTDGTYEIDPDGSGSVSPLDVHCDMTTDGGVGHTMVRFDDMTLGGNQDDYRAKCAAKGMEVIVPRTREHAEAIRAWNNGAPPNLVNVYPKSNGATGLSNWEGKCQGQSCSFFLDESNSAGCTGFEPNGDNNTSDALYRESNNCLYGRWNDRDNTMSIGGWVICSTNDADPAVAKSCTDYRFEDRVHNASVDGTSGVYTVDPDGAGGAAPYEAHCDMQTAGGGWTMALKADGAQQTFSYGKSIWTNNATLNTAGSALDRTEAKLSSYNDQPFTQVLVGLEAPKGSGGLRLSDFRMTPVVAEATSLFDLISPGNHVATNIGRAGWKQMVSGSSLQPNCNREGFNLTAGNIYSKARIGIIGNQENNCTSPDSRIGIGTAGTSCGTQNLSVGNSANCNPDNGNVDIAGWGGVWVRNVPVMASCQALLNAGYDRDGRYVIDPDGQGGQDPKAVYCDMTTDGGGWTLVTINGHNGRPTSFSGNSYPRPGASNYGKIGAAVEDVRGIQDGSVTNATNYSIDAKELYAQSSRDFLAYVGGPTRDYITGRLPAGCNYFDGSTFCQENSGNQFTVSLSDGTTVTSNAQACTTANGQGQWSSDPYTEFGLHLIDGNETDSRDHCSRGSTTLGHENTGRIYTTFEGDRAASINFWNGGVHSYWDNSASGAQPGYLMIR